MNMTLEESLLILSGLFDLVNAGFGNETVYQKIEEIQRHIRQLENKNG